MKKIIITVFLLITSLISLHIMNAESTTTLELISDLTVVEPGDYLVYTMKLKNTNDYNMINYNILFDDESLEYISSNLSREDDGINYDIRYAELKSPGELVIAFMFADTYHNNNANLGTITFKVKEGVKGNILPKIEGLSIIKGNLEDPTDENSSQEIPCSSSVEEVSVNVLLESISFNTDDLTLKREEKTLIPISYNPSNATVISGITYSSSNTSIVKIENDKLVAVSPGNAYIYADFKGKRITLPVTINNYLIGDINLDNKVDNKDVFLAIKVVLKIIPSDSSYLPGGDTNSDNKITNQDIMYMIKKILKIV